MPKYEAAIYNAEVRQKVADGEHHKHLDDEWADMHYIEIVASNEKLARNVVEVKHPRALGFVLGEIIVVD